MTLAAALAAALAEADFAAAHVWHGREHMSVGKIVADRAELPAFTERLRNALKPLGYGVTGIVSRENYDTGQHHAMVCLLGPGKWDESYCMPRSD